MGGCSLLFIGSFRVSEWENLVLPEVYRWLLSDCHDEMTVWGLFDSFHLVRELFGRKGS